MEEEIVGYEQRRRNKRKAFVVFLIAFVVFPVVLGFVVYKVRLVLINNINHNNDVIINDNIDDQWGLVDLAYENSTNGGVIIYTCTTGGWVKRVRLSDASRVSENWVNTGGTPLGIVLDYNNDNLVFVTDSQKGLLSITKDKGEMKILTDEAEGVKFKLTAGLDVADDVLLTNLYANGVGLSPDQSYLHFCETPLKRCMKYYIKGEKKGSVETLMEKRRKKYYINKASVVDQTTLMETTTVDDDDDDDDDDDYEYMSEDYFITMEKALTRVHSPRKKLPNIEINSH
ncbi:uncharacterized protein LOC115695829 isoform X2 [Cannabis sativa]|uniref:uncharacterized protein LOC115695829 isoform X2 n=1 Tax=Cannabis sativa TaxID=3483 RepID=UPI0029CA453D|nr:uncharacterized protein LOC115695829 isoform X2 [Cannabis sativa]